MNRFSKKLIPLLLVVLLFVVGGCATIGKKGDWVSLFDGKSLKGWKQLTGHANYYVEDDCIVGSSVSEKVNSFLCTEKHYGDFILEFEVKVDQGLNSGVQIRSNQFKDYKNGLVHGYQVEIDPSERAYSGGIYDEARRGWLNDLKDNEEARKAFINGQWNKYRVECIGDSIKTWVNGVPAADLVDSMTLSGFIGLQVHATQTKEPLRVRWRNIRIQDLGRHVWKPLFDGKNLKGWHAIGGGQWKIVDGVIEGSCTKSEEYHGLLISDKCYDDFTIRLKFKAVKGNSGFYFRSDEVPEDKVGVHGFQAEIDDNQDVGGLYETRGRGWVVKPSAEEVAKWFKPQEWNQMTVSAHGGRIVVHVNDQKTAELKDDPGRLQGHLAFQLHGGQDAHVMLKDVEILMPAEL